ncbi:hypothetical protein GDO81_014830 [Engystomops pustulosus]|uniref:Secreted protein n=1 Tax=Engystomops pustulosus TaxID=76066 RepID=A0AAV7AFR7_ENGPU|nr:hypothetical protein GDO81_014830 [Engystomops pustulosus]
MVIRIIGQALHLLLRFFQGNTQPLFLPSFCIIHVEYLFCFDGDGSSYIQDAAHHERIGGRRLVQGSGPGLLYYKRYGI